MNKAALKNPTDKAVLSVVETHTTNLPETEDRPIAEILRAAHARMEAEDEADQRNKAELDDLVGRLIVINERKRQAYKDHAAARLQRQVDAAAMAQAEDDEREAIYAEEGDVLFKMRQKLYGKYTLPIFLPGEYRPGAESVPKTAPRKRKWWK